VHLGAASVTVLPERGHEQARRSALSLGEALHLALQRLPTRVTFVVARIHTTDPLSVGLKAPEHLLERQRNFPHGSTRAHGFDAGCEQVTLRRTRHRIERIERGAHPNRVAVLPQLCQPSDLLLAHLSIVDDPERRRLFCFRAVAIHAHQDIQTSIEASLSSRCRLLYRGLRDPLSDCLRHAPELEYALDVPACTFGERLRERLHEIGATPGV